MSRNHEKTQNVRNRMTTCAVRHLAIVAMGFASLCCLAQPSELEADAKFRATIDAVRQKVLPEKGRVGSPSGAKTLQALLARLTQIDNINQLCEQGLGSERLCATRSAQVGDALAVSMRNPMYQSMDLSQFPKGLGAAVSVALRKPESLTQSKTKANLEVADLSAYTGKLGKQNLDARLQLRSFLNQLPTMALADGILGFKSSDQAAMAGELMADFSDALIENVAISLERCAPQDIKGLGINKFWFGTPEAIELSSCVANVFSARTTTEHLHRLAQILQLPNQWIQQDIFQPKNREVFSMLALLGRVMQVTQIIPFKAMKTGFTYMQFSVPFKVAGITCDTSNKYCRSMVERNDAKARCALDGQVLESGLCYQVADAMYIAEQTLNEVYPVWPHVFDVLRALQGKPSQMDEVRQYMGMSANLSDSFARIAQEPQSSLVIKLKLNTQTGFLFDSQAWVVDSLTLRN